MQANQCPKQDFFPHTKSFKVEGFGSGVILSKDGYIILHDCNPPTEFHQRENYEVNGSYPTWNGTTWKSYAKIRMTDESLSLYCINCDWGVGVIRRGKAKLFPLNKNLEFEFLERNRKELLNLISVKKFLEL